MTARALVDLGSLRRGDGVPARGSTGASTGTGGHPERLHPLYTIDGLDLGPEAVIETLPGYAGSRPVRVGNAANRQVQLDVFGPIADLIAAVADLRGRGPGRRVARAWRRWSRPSTGAGTSPTTASGRRAWRRGTTSTPRSCAG